ncbi:21133_t:CDS:2 [Gigaspora margarita]|uniref:21133_t:CDS:1 n=1 Tax=Gigaspora margarita TaxID=4874 RepID=A0ABN7VJE3_GIGMA|nr:21133_t:CDS:2 [Gigaspora margarita]
MPRNYPEECSECNGYCLYARFSRRDLVLTSVHNELNPQINEFDCPNQFIQQSPFVRPNHIGSFLQHNRSVGPVQNPHQLLTLNGPQYPRVNGPDQLPQYPCISRPDQLPQINEINNVNDLNYIPAEPNQPIQYPNNQTTNSIRNYSIQPTLTPMQANIQINNNLQRQPSFASQASNVTVQPLLEFRNCNCLVCSILKNQCFQSICDEQQNENCVTRNEQNEEVNVNNATVIINNNNPQDSQDSKKLKYINEKHRYEDEIRAKDKMLLLMGNEIHRCDEKLKLIDDASNIKDKMLLKYEKALTYFIKLAKRIECLKIKLENCKTVSTAISDGDEIQKKKIKSNYIFPSSDTKALYHLRLEHKRLVNEIKEYEKNETISNVVNIYEKTKILYN